MYYKKVPEITTQEKGTHKGYAHNSYLQMLAEIGIFGLLTFLWGIYSCFWENRKSKLDDFKQLVRYGLSVASLAFLIQSFVDNQLFAFQTATLFWLFFGIYVATKLRIATH